jgi:hypothetical protein
MGYWCGGQFKGPSNYSNWYRPVYIAIIVMVNDIDYRDIVCDYSDITVYVRCSAHRFHKIRKQLISRSYKFCRFANIAVDN